MSPLVLQGCVHVHVCFSFTKKGEKSNPIRNPALLQWHAHHVSRRHKGSKQPASVLGQDQDTSTLNPPNPRHQAILHPNLWGYLAAHSPRPRVQSHPALRIRHNIITTLGYHTMAGRSRCTQIVLKAS
jgi:hypothetical protein